MRDDDGNGGGFTLREKRGRRRVFDTKNLSHIPGASASGYGERERGRFFTNSAKRGSLSLAFSPDSQIVGKLYRWFFGGLLKA